MPITDWDDAYANAAHIPGAETFLSDWPERSRRLRAAHAPERLIYGSGARPNRNMQAAQQRIETPTGLRVIVVMGKVDVSDPAVAKGFCDVGRAAEVHFAMKAGTKFDFYLNQLKTFLSDRIKFAGAEKVDVANIVIEN